MSSTKDPRAKLVEAHCKPHGHAHGLNEVHLCAEALLAEHPGSTGLKLGLFPGTPPALKEFYEQHCLAQKHTHDERSAVLCIDLIYRRSIKLLGRKISTAQERAAASQRPSGSVY
jgi:hypothetical protein